MIEELGMTPEEFQKGFSDFISNRKPEKLETGTPLDNLLKDGIPQGSDSSLKVRVKHIIEYLQKNFSPNDEVFLEHDGWMIGEYGDNPENELDVIKNRGIFTKFGNSMFIEN